eukprot:UN29670
MYHDGWRTKDERLVVGTWKKYTGKNNNNFAIYTGYDDHSANFAPFEPLPIATDIGVQNVGEYTLTNIIQNTIIKNNQSAKNLSSKKITVNVIHCTTAEEHANGIMEGIDPRFFAHGRFGAGFYMA